MLVSCRHLVLTYFCRFRELREQTEDKQTNGGRHHASHAKRSVYQNYAVLTAVQTTPTTPLSLSVWWVFYDKTRVHAVSVPRDACFLVIQELNNRSIRVKGFSFVFRSILILACQFRSF
jgi:hypothetical protein